jgi:hypothetical protein
MSAKEVRAAQNVAREFRAGPPGVRLRARSSVDDRLTVRDSVLSIPKGQGVLEVPDVARRASTAGGGGKGGGPSDPCSVSASGMDAM